MAGRPPCAGHDRAVWAHTLFLLGVRTMACVLGTAAGASSEGDLWQGRSHRQVSRVQEHTTGGEIPASGGGGTPRGPPRRSEPGRPADLRPSGRLQVF